MKTSLITTFVALMASSLPIAATPLPAEGEVQERQAFLDIFLMTILQSTATGIMNEFLGPEIPGCTFDSSSQDNWWTRAYHVGDDGKNHSIAEICWSAGGYHFTKDDASVVSCLLDLHVKQPSTCIDVEGSSCDTHPGTGVGNVRNIYSLSLDNDQQIDSTSAELTKAAFSKMINNDKGWDIGTYMNIMPMNDDGTYTSWSIQVRGTGADDC